MRHKNVTAETGDQRNFELLAAALTQIVSEIHHGSRAFTLRWRLINHFSLPLRPLLLLLGQTKDHVASIGEGFYRSAVLQTDDLVQRGFPHAGRVVGKDRQSTTRAVTT